MKEENALAGFAQYVPTLVSLDLGGGTASRVSILCASLFLVIISTWWFLLLPQTDETPFFSPYPSKAAKYGAGDQQQQVPAINTPSGVVCDIASGTWVPYNNPILYSNRTCKYMLPNQNCIQNGRPDIGYLYWRWKPSECDLPPFNATHFLQLMQGKRIAFIGDSLARNQVHSLICLLSNVEDPLSVISTEQKKEWHFPLHNCTVVHLWSPFLLNYTVSTDVYHLHLDVVEKLWSSQVADFGIAIISMGFWFFRKSVYYANGMVMASSKDAGLNITEIELPLAFRIALKTVMQFMAKEYKGLTMLRTVTVPHFEHGSWMNGGVCNRTVPFFEDGGQKRPLLDMDDKMHRAQVEEFEEARELAKAASRFELLDVTYSASMRPDGHPGPYRIFQWPGSPPNDCLHWCMPGPVDMWNQLLLNRLSGG